MSVKTTGAEYKKYYAETDHKWWPPGSFCDDVVLRVNGDLKGDDNHDFDPDTLNDSDAVVIECGTYYSSPDDCDDPVSLETHFKRWRKDQTTVRIAVEVHKDKADALKAVIKANGGKVA